jgi:DNA gyrase subunit A
VNEIRETGRNAAGVRLIKLDEGDRLVALAKVEPEEDGGEAQPSAEVEPPASPVDPASPPAPPAPPASPSADQTADGQTPT